MKLSSVAFPCSILLFALFAHPLAAQTSSPAADSVSGTWTGHMARGTDRMPITVTLKVEGISITGSVEGPPSPGIIKRGTFDKATSALVFEVEVQDASRTLVTFQGKVVNDTATGSVTLNNQTGTFTMTKGPAVQTPSSQPQAGGMTIGEGLQKSFATVSDHITKSADMIPADKYAYRPAKTVRTVGELIGHVADGYNYFCAMAAGRKIQWSDALATGATDKATIAGKLKQATDACTASYAAGAHLPLIENLTHTNLHYGNLITYLRMLGLVPPSS